jgi:hypothetical protein
MNEAIDEVNQLIKAKYNLLSQSMLKLSGESLKRYKVSKKWFLLFYPRVLKCKIHRNTKKWKRQKQRGCFSSPTMTSKLAAW